MCPPLVCPSLFQEPEAGWDLGAQARDFEVFGCYNIRAISLHFVNFWGPNLVCCPLFWIGTLISPDIGAIVQF